MRSRYWAIAAVSVGLTLLVANPVAGADFNVDSRDWHGLSDFRTLAGHQGVELYDTNTLDWEQVDTNDIIVVVYPAEPLDVASFAGFVIDGGRVLLADDFGASKGLLERLTVDRTEPLPEELPHRHFVDDHRGWPRFSIEGRHPLLEGVDEVVANYPAVLHNVGGAVIGYDQDGGLVYDMKLGDGRVVVVADPGLFINIMLPVADNRQFAANIWSYLCEDVEECRAWGLIHTFESEGAYGEESTDADPHRDIQERVDAFNERVREAFEELPGTELLYLIGIFLVFGTVAYATTVFPWRRSRRLSEYIERHRDEVSPPLTEFDWNLERFANPDGRINYALPVAVLKESFEELFLDQFGLWPSKPGKRPPVSELARRFDERYLRGQPPQKRKRRRREVEHLLVRLTAIPSRHRVFLESDEHFSARDMMRLHRRIQRVLSWMGLQESYERRTRELDARRLRSRRR